MKAPTKNISFHQKPPNRPILVRTVEQLVPTFQRSDTVIVTIM